MFLKENSYGPSRFAKILIEGNKRQWVNGKLKIAEGIVNGFEKQSTVFRKLRIPLIFIVSIFPGFGFLSILSIISEAIGITSNTMMYMQQLAEYDIKISIILLFLSCIFGWWPAFLFITDIERKLWPSIEIRIGPSHQFSEMKRRIRAGYIITIILIPTIIAIALKALLD